MSVARREGECDLLGEDIMAEVGNQVRASDTQSDEDERLDEEVDTALEETFPASDPPSWTLGTDHPVETKSRPDSSGSRDEDTSE